MKTNKILMAVALPALLAACTAEEFEQVSVQEQTLANRALLNPNFAINVAEIESRFAWENAVWKYEAGDQFGAAITDAATLWTVSDASMFGNYIFAKNEAGNYVTDSQMGEGVYMLYSFDGFNKKMARNLVEFDLTKQVCDLDEPAAEINKYENQLMFTPLYKIQEKYSAEPIAPTFYSYYGVGAFKFKNSTGQNLKITQIILKHDADMIVKGRISQEALAANAQYVYNESKEGYVLKGIHNALESKTMTTAQKNAAIEAAEDAFESTIYTAKAVAAFDATKGDKNSKFITLDCQNYLMKDGDEKTAYMLVPAGYEGFEVEIMVVDEDGEAWSVYANANGEDDDENPKTKGIKVTGMDDLSLQRHKGNMIFGKSSDGKTMKTLNIKEENLSEKGGYYVDSKAAMLELLDANLGDIKVHNSGDWAIDAEVVEAIVEYTGANITFSNPIEIKSATALTAEDDLALENVTFTDVTVIGTRKAADNETVIFAGTTVELNVTVTGTLKVEAGANVTILGGTYGNVENNGTLSIQDLTSGTLKNKVGGVMTLYKNHAVTAEAGTVKFLALEGKKANAYNVTSNIALTAGANLEIGQYVTFKPADGWSVPATTTATSKLTNNGVVTSETGNNLVKVYGKFVNNGVLSTNLQAYNKAEITNAVDAEMTKAVALIEKSTMINNGIVNNLQYYGKLLTLGADSETTISAGSAGEIDNTNKGAIVAGSGIDLNDFEIYYNFAGTVAELEAVPFAWYNINTLRINGTLTFARGFDMKNTTALTQMSNLNKLVLADGATINVQTDKVVATFNEIETEGCATIKGIKGVSNLIIVTTEATIGTTIYNEATSDDDAEFGHTLSVKNIAVSAVREVSGVQTATTFAIKAVNEETAEGEVNVNALVDIVGGSLTYSVVEGATADKKWYISTNGSDPAIAQ